MWRVLVTAGFLLLMAGFVGAQDNDVNVISLDKPNSVKLIAQDMHLPHEAKLHGAPAYFDWFTGPRIGMGLSPQGFKAMTAWGQVYEAEQGSPARNTRVLLRNIKAFCLSASDGEWHMLQGSRSVNGEAYAEDFVDNINIAADVRSEDSGGVSVIVGNGLNYHFWPTGERAVLPLAKNISGIFTTVQARLVVDDPAKPDDRACARILVGMGGDYWRDGDAQCAPNYANNNDIGIGRHRYVKTGWQSFNMTTMSLAELQKTPPPLE